MFLHTLIQNPLLFGQVILIVIISICLHELAHGIAAICQGDDTPERRGHMTLNPFVHMGVPSMIFLCLTGISWGSMPVNPRNFHNPKLGNIIVSAAGPVLNLTLAIILISLVKVISWLGVTNWGGVKFLLLAARINLVLFLFNLIPLPPLDGFSILSELLPSLKPLQRYPYGFVCLIPMLTCSASSIKLATGSSFLLATLSGSQIALVIALALILGAITFSIANSSLTESKRQTGQERSSRQKKKGLFEGLKDDRLWRKLLNLKRVDLRTAQRLIDFEKRRNPGQPDSWYLEKVIYDLTRGR